MRRREPRPRFRNPILWGALAGIFLFAAGTPRPAGADEIRFRTGAVAREGTVLEENGDTVTIRFPRKAIESITREAGARPERPAGERADSGLEERVRQLERRMESLASGSGVGDSREKSGEVEGVVRWRNLPLSHARVLVVPRIAAGRPPAANGPGDAAGAGANPVPEGSFETRTDADGRYRFERIPPGEYLLYWMPDEKAGWVRRLRDRPDLVVAPGRTTVLNIPEEGN